MIIEKIDIKIYKKKESEISELQVLVEEEGDECETDVDSGTYNLRKTEARKSTSLRLEHQNTEK